MLDIKLVFYSSANEDTGASLDWTLRQGRGTALGVALQTAADKLWTDQYRSGVQKAITALTEADRVRTELLCHWVFHYYTEITAIYVPFHYRLK